MPTRVLLVGLDGADPALLERWSGEGRLPAFTSLTRDAAVFRLANSLESIGGGVWEELNSGRSCGRTGIFFPPRQLRTGETAPRPLALEEMDPRAFWTVASDAGQRVAVIDLPHSVPPGELNGVFLTEWGSHDRFWGTSSLPAGLVEEVRAKHGEYATWSREWPRPTTAVCDSHDGSHEQYSQLLDDFLAGIAQKTAVALEVLGREHWDLVACAFAEGQCSGHQLWHFLDTTSADVDPRLANGIRSVYEQLDSALAALVDAAGPDAIVMLVASHGYIEPTGGRQLIPEVLVRLGYGSGSSTSARARSRVPPSLRKLARRLLPRGARETLQAKAGSLPNPLDSPLTKAVALDGDRCSWIRLNLEGREPHGAVEPAEADELLADIRTQLLLLEHPETGERIVSEVHSAEEAFGADHHPDVPDLIVNFRADLGTLDACRSDRVGLVRVPLLPTARRTGAHPAIPTVLWVSGIDDPAAGREAGGVAVDLAPTVLSVLGVRPPTWLDGTALV